MRQEEIGAGWGPRGMNNEGVTLIPKWEVISIGRKVCQKELGRGYRHRGLRGGKQSLLILWRVEVI